MNAAVSRRRWICLVASALGILGVGGLFRAWQVAKFETDQQWQPSQSAEAEGKPTTPVIDHQTTDDLPQTSSAAPDAPDDEPGSQAGDERDDNELGMKFVWCPAGKFRMGSQQNEAGRDSGSEEPVEVELTQGFWLGKFEVTQGEWKRLMGSTPWKEQVFVREGPQYAASYVSCDEALEFARKMTKQETREGRLPAGWEYALPTEAQWEYACRAGSTTVYCFGDAAEQLGGYAWWGGLFGNGSAKTEQYAHEVGRKRANAWGLHDLHGNVYEWCRDGYESKLPGGADPLVQESTVRASRGGGWFNHAVTCRSASRNRFSTEVRMSFLGFRLARVPVR